MASLNPSTITLIVLVPLIIWRMYSRIRRMVGRQRLSKVRPWITLAIFPLIVAMLALSALHRPERLGILGVGLAVGIGLALFGLKRTKFEVTPQGFFYTPNAHLGIALSLLFVARILYRFIEIYALNPTVPRDMREFGSSPLTLAVFGLLAGYYIGYAVGLVRWRATAARTSQLPPEPSPPPASQEPGKGP
jgi:tellurite resistance protein TehA-like permease